MTKPTQKKIDALQSLKGIKVMLSDALPSQTMVVSKDLYEAFKEGGDDAASKKD